MVAGEESVFETAISPTGGAIALGKLGGVALLGSVVCGGIVGLFGLVVCPGNVGLSSIVMFGLGTSTLPGVLVVGV